MHYKYWYNDLYAFEKLVTTDYYVAKIFERRLQMVMINSIQTDTNNTLQIGKNFNNSIKDYVCFDYMNDEQLYEEHCEIKHYVDLIDTRCYYNLGSFYLRELEDI